VREVLKKSSDLKVKVREASVKMCQWLGHQSPVGPELMATTILDELEQIIKRYQESHSGKSSKSKDSAQALGNSNMWTTCLSLLSDF